MPNQVVSISVTFNRMLRTGDVYKRRFRPWYTHKASLPHRFGSYLSNPILLKAIVEDRTERIDVPSYPVF